MAKSFSAMGSKNFYVKQLVNRWLQDVVFDVLYEIISDNKLAKEVARRLANSINDYFESEGVSDRVTEKEIFYKYLSSIEDALKDWIDGYECFCPREVEQEEETDTLEP